MTNTEEQANGPYIECKDLFKIYKRAELEVVALRGLDLEIAEGELMAIVGASGSGKSTLLNILAGLDTPSAGAVRVGERDLLGITQRDLLTYRRLEVGFIWQAIGRNLVPYLGARDNIELPMAIAGLPAKERRERSMELLSTMGLEKMTNRMPNELSGGEQQRVAIGVALANSPPLLLADEPTGELDTANAHMVLNTMREMNLRLGVTTVVVTHYPGIAQFVDRVVYIRDGRISSETIVRPTFSKPGELQAQDYVVVDQVGRLQLPRQFLEEGGVGRRVKVVVKDGQITIDPVGNEDGR